MTEARWKTASTDMKINQNEQNGDTPVLSR